MINSSKYEIMCLERGDIDYLLHVAEALSNARYLTAGELKNYSEALRGIVNAAKELTNL